MYQNGWNMYGTNILIELFKMLLLLDVNFMYTNVVGLKNY